MPLEVPRLPAAILVYLALALALTSAPLLALPEAREAMRDEGKGLTVYQGDVVITQGTILIRADRVSVYSDGRQVSRIVCTGNPAHYQQVPEPDKALVEARAGTISYELNSEKIVLAGNASLKQEDATLTGERIEYDLRQDIIRAEGGGDNQRIRMVIPPNQQGVD